MSDFDTANHDLTLIAPAFRRAVEAAIEECARHVPRLDVKVHEGFRSQARQSWLYQQGRSRPGNKVTNAPTSLTSWHGYGLAVDIVHLTQAYWPFGRDPAHAAQNEKWFADVAKVFKANGCSWGGDWKHPDTPHMQWWRCTASPTQGARDLMRTSGVRAVWKSLQADA